MTSFLAFPSTLISQETQHLALKLDMIEPVYTTARLAWTSIALRGALFHALNSPNDTPNNSKVVDCILFPLLSPNCTRKSGERGILFTEQRGDPRTRRSRKMKPAFVLQRCPSAISIKNRFWLAHCFSPLTGWTHLVSLVSSLSGDDRHDLFSCVASSTRTPTPAQ